jgi:hypothetical protein
MGRTECDRHVIAGIALVCRHVADDVEAHRTLRPFAVYRTHVDGTDAIDHTFCFECVAELALPTPPEPLSFGEPELPLSPVCELCLADAVASSASM